RRDLALLRTRGATPRVLAGLGVSEALLVGGIAAVAGLGTAAIVGELAFGTADFGATTATAAAWAGAAVLAGIVVAVLTIAVPIWRDARTVNVVTARRTIGRVGT